MDENKQYKSNMEAVGINVKVVESCGRREKCYDIILRILGLLLTFVAAIVAGTDKQTTMLRVSLVDTLSPVEVPVTAKWQYLSSFVYLMVSNVIACSYAAGSLVYILANGKIKNIEKLLLIILDIMIMVLLFSANGAVAGVGLIGRNGNPHVQWKKVCNVVDDFCRQMAAAFSLSLAGSLVFFGLVVLAVWHLHKKLAS